MINMLILSLVVLAVAGSGIITHAQTTVDWVPLDIHIEVTDAVTIQGEAFTVYGFTVDVTNTGMKTTHITDIFPYADVSDDDHISCSGSSTATMRPNQTRTFDICYILSDRNATPSGIVAFGTGYEVIQLPFTSADLENCLSTVGDGKPDICLPVQSIRRMMGGGSEPEPTTCEVPTPTNTSRPDIAEPSLLSAAYHPYLGALVLSFAEDVTLADGWQENITIGGTSIGERAENRMTGSSSLAWISVEYQVMRDLWGADSYIVTIEPNTLVNIDGNPNDRIQLLPTITG